MLNELFFFFRCLFLFFIHQKRKTEKEIRFFFLVGEGMYDLKENETIRRKIVFFLALFELPFVYGVFTFGGWYFSCPSSLFFFYSSTSFFLHLIPFGTVSPNESIRHFAIIYLNMVYISFGSLRKT